ncbi:hypothetical protein BS47DRAFT_1320943 [Hydnum rufescens UP504]|uniref:Replication termination factor 2 n=1 Tax=Hydnum rufescens UP504 TaxID=1448309 RepID=A0A9P6AMA5_9AGAM|nr:hypothetical protein BS47DRAFT_1320943 [Hydnum rufescens UP504]
MGNDGGSIPDRRDLVKNKPKAEQADRNNQAIAQWFFCALSKRELQEPIVSCALGKLYNKDAILEYLLDRSAYGDGEEICGHIRSLKDVTTLKLTKNPAEPISDDKNTSRRQAMFICPLTLKEMSGATPFVHITACGDVFSAAGLRAVFTSTALASNVDPDASREASSSNSGSTSPPEGFELCPQCGKKFDKAADVRPINPPSDITEQLREAMIKLRASQAAKSKSKKRKADAEAESNPKRSKPSNTTAANGGVPIIAVASRKVAAELAEEEKRRKEKMSAAVASLYQQKDAKPAKETFLTMGTFTRYA